ncbi:MAG TPA: SDR family NAD(P)-dependent oxidoreductase [Nitrososphaerales archaeon]|nr:SDR family NAD(P)-dependent oxidoreductase [Nitrososphaerales archaeon]
MAGKVVVITGASSGIGAALARQLGARGELLALGARREPLLRNVATESGSRALAVATDVTKRGDVERLRDAALKEYGRVDVWVNNAGRGINRRVEDLTEEDVRSTIDVVLMSVIYGMQAILPHFKERGEGHIINVSSFLGRVPFTPYRSIYSAAKSAVNVLSANLRMDLKSKYPGIHVSVMMPGVVDTPFHQIAGPGLTVRAGGFLGQARVESADEAARRIVALIDKPAPEAYSNPAAVEMVTSYFKDVDAFEENFSRRETGNPRQ